MNEVNEWYEALRPTEPQIPPRDLSFTEILPLDDIGFEMSSAFGAKCSNVATMRTFGFPEGTIPDGFGVPFYFYDEFMQYNDFYEEAEVMINNPSFIYDIDFREDRLRDFRDDIRDAPMPPWMMDALQVMHDSFSGYSEDLPCGAAALALTTKIYLVSAVPDCTPHEKPNTPKKATSRNPSSRCTIYLVSAVPDFTPQKTQCGISEPTRNVISTA